MVACSKKRKADCMNSTTCRWIVGKGCSKKSKPKTKTPSRPKTKTPSRPKTKTPSRPKTKTPSRPKTKTPSRPKSKPKKVACSKKRKADCMNSTTCRWIVGKGCSKKLKTPSPKHLGQAGSNVLQYLDQKNVYFEDLGDCLQDVVVENYLANGAFGVVYAVKYKGKECAMKVVSEKNIDYINYTDMKEAEKEAESLKKASDLGIGPKLYEFRICAVKMPAKFKDKKFYIGVFILEKLDKTLLELMKETIDELKTKNISKERKLVEIDNFKVYLENVADKIIKDCKKAHENKLYIDDLHPGNIMIRKDGSPIISDWGILDRSGRAELICNDVKKEILHVYNWALK